MALVRELSFQAILRCFLAMVIVEASYSNKLIQSYLNDGGVIVIFYFTEI